MGREEAGVTWRELIVRVWNVLRLWLSKTPRMCPDCGDAMIRPDDSCAFRECYGCGRREFLDGQLCSSNRTPDTLDAAQSVTQSIAPQRPTPIFNAYTMMMPELHAEQQIGPRIAAYEERMKLGAELHAGISELEAKGAEWKPSRGLVRATQAPEDTLAETPPAVVASMRDAAVAKIAARGARIEAWKQARGRSTLAR